MLELYSVCYLLYVPNSNSHDMIMTYYVEHSLNDAVHSHTRSDYVISIRTQVRIIIHGALERYG
jgi:hypothetical protein